MSIYVYKNGEQLGPYTKDQVTKALQAGDLNETDKAWASGVSDWTELKSLMSTAPVGCPQCRGQLILETEHPQRGIGIIVMVLGILLAPVCVGFIFIFGNYILDSRTEI